MFPALIGEDESIVRFSRLKIYVLELCEVLSEDIADEYRLAILSEQWALLITPSKPLNFTSSDPENVLTQMDRHFTEMCSLMEKNGSTDPAKYSVIQFYAKIDFIHKELKRHHGQPEGEYKGVTIGSGVSN